MKLNRPSDMAKHYSKQNVHVRYQNGSIQNGNMPSINQSDKIQRHKYKNKDSVDRVVQTTTQTCGRNEKGETATSPDKSPETTTGSSSNKAAHDMADLFPRNTHWAVFLFTLVFRVWYVSRKENWWILHPDEIYQTLEVAHSEVYGFGFRTYEYLPEKITGYHMNAARAQEVTLGMYSLRSFMLPNLISVIMFLVDEIGLPASPILVGKASHAIITSVLTLSVYYFSRSVFKSRDTASLAAILVSTSQSLNVFGTHTLINSFLAPFMFLSLTPLVKVLLCNTEQNLKTTVLDSQVLSLDQNSNLTVTDKNHFPNGIGESASNNTYALKIKSKQNGHVPVDTTNKRSLVHLHKTLVISGFVLSLCVYSRCDIILMPIFMVIACSKLSCRKSLSFIKRCQSYVCGFATGILLAGLYDKVWYGSWFISPYQWIKFNVFHATSQVLFGKQSVTFYVQNVLCADSLNILFCVIIILDLFMAHRLSLEFVDEKLQWKQAEHVPFYMFIFLLLTYSMSAHKETRFFHNGLVFMLIHLSSAILRLFKTIVNSANQKHGQYYCWLYLFIGVLASSQMFSFIKIQGNAISKWSYMGNSVSQDFNQCLHYISQQTDVTGVFLEQPVYMTGGYTILHKDVPMFALNMYEFFEFSHSSRLNLQGVYNQNISLSFAYISDYVSVHNTHYLLKQLISKPEYNYLVLNIDRKFIETGYNEVFRTGSAMVINRQRTDESEAELFKMAYNIPLGQNSTILEYEGYWLLQYGLYELAQEKLLLANHLDTSRIGPYQLLIRLFHYFKQTDLVQSVLDSCLVKHKRSKCVSEYKVIKQVSG